MEVGCLLLFRTLSSPLIRPPLRRHSWPVPSSPLLRASSSPPPLPSPPSAYPQGAYRGPKPRRDLVGDWVSNNDGFVRSLPIFVGGLSLLAVLLNRAFSGIAPVTDASRAWESLSATTCCRSLVVVHGGFCLLQIGVAAESLTEVGEAVAVDVHKLIQSSVYRNVAESGKRRELFGKPISLSCKVRASLLTYYYTGMDYVNCGEARCDIVKVSGQLNHCCRGTPVHHLFANECCLPAPLYSSLSAGDYVDDNEITYQFINHCAWGLEQGLEWYGEIFYI
ncbi:uncharacterized protein LOC103715882 isoform X5 [Phoenix dactylifera]|uniref:Uncharacterized protein LOC103715882 isoform X5 n=1 Tax=Phoenix dactylifera TaxID=42345 RepID=A0A8B8J955_PHODC|nr:uncharacterized protein LOC103715882 isoform X5 [Phoenix dactylifera]